jgi:hemerythrin-like domain-containing protein
MKPTEQLTAEHRSILSMLEVFTCMAEQLEAGEPIPPDHLEQGLTFIREFADHCHHGKEEDHLFTAMEAAGIPREGGPVAVMLYEHDQGREYVRNMATALEAYRAGNQEAGSTFSDNAHGYISLLKQHIHKEDHILYPIADQHLSADQQATLKSAFEQVDRQRFGGKTKEELIQILEELKAVYLS